MKTFYVTVAQTSLIRCEVEAESAAHAQEVVEGLGVDEFKNETLSCTSEVDRIDDENGNLVRWWETDELYQHAVAELLKPVSKED